MLQPAVTVTAQISPANYDKAGIQYPLEWPAKVSAYAQSHHHPVESKASLSLSDYSYRVRAPHARSRLMPHRTPRRVSTPQLQRVITL
jgi:hypothetical protein